MREWVRCTTEDGTWKRVQKSKKIRSRRIGKSEVQNIWQGFDIFYRSESAKNLRESESDVRLIFPQKLLGFFMKNPKLTDKHWCIFLLLMNQPLIKLVLPLIGKDTTPNFRESESNGILKLKSEKTFSEDNQNFIFPPKQRKSGKFRMY